MGGIDAQTGQYDDAEKLDFFQKVGKHMSEAEKILVSVAAQLMNGEQVAVGDQKIRVQRVGRGRFRMVQFKLNGRTMEAIEQNPDKPSHWGKLARQKHQVVQFRDLDAHKYVAVSVDGDVKVYGK